MLNFTAGRGIVKRFDGPRAGARRGPVVTFAGGPEEGNARLKEMAPEVPTVLETILEPKAGRPYPSWERARRLPASPEGNSLS